MTGPSVTQQSWFPVQQLLPQQVVLFAQSPPCWLQGAAMHLPPSHTGVLPSQW